MYIASRHGDDCISHFRGGKDVRRPAQSRHPHSIVNDEEGEEHILKLLPVCVHGVVLPDRCAQSVLYRLQGFPLGDFHLEDVMLPEDDDMGIPSDEDDDLEEEVKTETGFGCVVGEYRNTVIDASNPVYSVGSLDSKPSVGAMLHFKLCVSSS